VCLERSNELLIRCDRHDYYYGNRDVHLRILLRQLSSHRQPFLFATANTPEQASVLARAQSNTLFTAEQVLPELEKLAITQLLLDSKTQQQLQRVGVRSVKALFALPMEELAGRFSQSVIKMIYALKGLHKFGRVFYQPSETFCESIELPFDMDAHDHLFRWASSLLTLLQSYLRSRNQTTQALMLVLTDSEKCVHPLALRSGTPKYRVDEWQPILNLVLEKTVLSNPIRSMQLRCDNAVQASPDATDLFLGKRANTVDAHKLFDVLQTRLGEGAFHPPKSDDSAWTKHWPTSFATPPFVLPNGQLLTASSHVIAGPQRIQTLWWHTPLKRDYFLVETRDNERLWAFRDDKQNWFYQGWFS
jgi:protein ImuB